MQQPFPEEVEVPYGLVHVRTICGLPVGIFLVLLLVGVAPFYVWGWRKWWVAALALVLGWVLAQPAREDTQFLSAWAGEMKLKDYYD